jgi:hypothetical protein
MRVVILALACCGGGDEATELSDAIGESLWRQSQADPETETFLPGFTEDDADCLGELTVDVIGYENLVEAGVTPESVREVGALSLPSVPTEQEDTFIEGMVECFDFPAALTAAAASDMGISEESARCLIDGLMEDPAFRSSMKDAVFAASSGDPFSDPEAMGALFDLVGTCLTDEELNSLMNQ